jgi:hypothetical protein
VRIGELGDDHAASGKWVANQYIGVFRTPSVSRFTLAAQSFARQSIDFPGPADPAGLRVPVWRDRIAEVEDFVDFLRLREKERALTLAAGEVSASVFAAVWSDAEDDVYDVF